MSELNNFRILANTIVLF